ncbi:hypothetical protein AFLA_006979 [Aspergillus flavus NRRL3357]|nr:hypothetical protein AFLA_006979 [Aspergillus flavus NRRL3357]
MVLYPTPRIVSSSIAATRRPKLRQEFHLGDLRWRLTYQATLIAPGSHCIISVYDCHADVVSKNSNDDWPGSTFYPSQGHLSPLILALPAHFFLNPGIYKGRAGCWKVTLALLKHL